MQHRRKGVHQLDFPGFRQVADIVEILTLFGQQQVGIDEHRFGVFLRQLSDRIVVGDDALGHAGCRTPHFHQARPGGGGVIELPGLAFFPGVIGGQVPCEGHQQHRFAALPGEVYYPLHVGAEGAAGLDLGAVGKLFFARPMLRQVRADFLAAHNMHGGVFHRIRQREEGQQGFVILQAFELLIKPRMRVIVAEFVRRDVVHAHVVDAVVHHHQIEVQAFLREHLIFQQAVARGHARIGEVIHPHGLTDDSCELILQGGLARVCVGKAVVHAVQCAAAQEEHVECFVALRGAIHQDVRVADLFVEAVHPVAPGGEDRHVAVVVFDRPVRTGGDFREDQYIQQKHAPLNHPAAKGFFARLGSRGRAGLIGGGGANGIG